MKAKKDDKKTVKAEDFSVEIPVTDEMEKPKQPTAQDQIKQTAACLDFYLNKAVVTDFSKMPSSFKLTVLQTTPKNFIKTRKVGNSQVPYVTHEYAEKALNFVFNFAVSAEMIKCVFIEYKEDFMNYNHKDAKSVDGGRSKIPVPDKRDVVEAEAHIRFTLKHPDTGEIIIRDVFPSHKGFKNPATTRGNVMQSAISKGWTICARTFGIGADIKDREEKAYNRAEKGQQYQPPVAKSVPKGTANY